MKAIELRGLSVEELKEKEKDFRGELFNLKIQRATGKIENPNRLKILRKDVARINTIMKENKSGEKT